MSSLPSYQIPMFIPRSGPKANRTASTFMGGLYPRVASPPMYTPSAPSVSSGAADDSPPLFSSYPRTSGESLYDPAATSAPNMSRSYTPSAPTISPNYRRGNILATPGERYTEAQNTIDAGNRIAATPPTPNQHLNADNGISDQVVREIWNTHNEQYPGEQNRAVREQSFNEAVARYGINGKAWLQGQGAGGPQTRFINGYNTLPGKPVTYPLYPSSLAGKSGPSYPGEQPTAQMAKLNDGSVVLMKPNGERVGPNLAQQSPIAPVKTPIMGPALGSTHVNSDYLLPYTAAIQKDADAPINANSKQRDTDLATLPLARIRDANQQTETPEAAARRTDTESRRFVNQGEGQMRDVEDNEARQDAVNRAIAGPTIVGRGGAGGVTGQARYADRVAFFKNLTGERVPDGSGGMRRMTFDEKMRATDSFLPMPPDPYSPSGASPSDAPPVSSVGALALHCAGQNLDFTNLTVLGNATIDGGSDGGLTIHDVGGVLTTVNMVGFHILNLSGRFVCPAIDGITIDAATTTAQITFNASSLSGGEQLVGFTFGASAYHGTLIADGVTFDLSGAVFPSDARLVKRNGGNFINFTGGTVVTAATGGELPVAGVGT